MSEAPGSLVSTSKNNRYLPAVDHLRALAVLLVLVYHGMQQIRITPGGGDPFPKVADPLSALVVEGHTGVALFMVLSGFILTRGALGNEIAYRPYLRNRLLRVGPMYLVVLVVAIYAVPAEFSFTNLMPYFTLTATPPLPVAGFGPWSTVLWSVSVELAFYLVFPFLLATLQRRGPQGLLRVMALVVALRFLVLANDGHAIRDLSYWTIVGRIDEFVLGMLAAWLLARRPRGTSGRPAAALGAVSLIGVSVALLVFNRNGSFYGDGRWKVIWPTVEGLLWAGVVVGYVGWSAGWGARRLTRWVAFPGIVSYSMFLLHYPVVAAVAERGWRIVDNVTVNAALLTLVVVIPVATMVAWLGYTAVERPFMERRSRYLTPIGDRAAGCT